MKHESNTTCNGQFFEDPFLKDQNFQVLQRVTACHTCAHTTGLLCSNGLGPL